MGEKSVKEAGIGTYLTIWAALIIFTGITVTTASLNLGQIGIVIVLSIAAIKSTLVLLYFHAPALPEDDINKTCYSYSDRCSRYFYRLDIFRRRLKVRRDIKYVNIGCRS